LSSKSRKRNRPIGVILLAVLQFASGVQLLIGSIAYLALVSWARTSEGVAELAKTGEWALENAGRLFLLLSVAYLVLGIGSLLLARGYIHGREWARRRGRIVAALAIAFALLGGLILPKRLDAGSPVWTVLFNILVIVYLGSGKVRRFFTK
jgi:hypothetical protein